MAYSIDKEKCIGCTLCAKSCPVKAISGALKEKHSIDVQRCIECGLCGRLCAKGAIIDGAGKAAERLPKAQWLRPVIDTELCSGCSMCVENCPEYCLEISPPTFHGDIRTFAMLKAPDKCIACGMCEKNCPVEAIRLAAPGK